MTWERVAVATVVAGTTLAAMWGATALTNDAPQYAYTADVVRHAGRPPRARRRTRGRR